MFLRPVTRNVTLEKKYQPRLRHFSVYQSRDANLMHGNWKYCDVQRP